MGQEHFQGQPLFAELTIKQREVFDLLIEHKTSKEIARLLRISPHTVDQRIQIAKDKLGARNRNEAAAIYRRLVETYDQMTYKNSRIAKAALGLDNGGGTQGSLPELGLRERTRSARPLEAEADYQVVPELFEGRYGTLVRLGAIVGIALFLVLLGLGGLAMFSQLSELMAA